MKIKYLFLLLLSASYCWGQEYINITVVDLETNNAIEGVHIFIANTTEGSFTDINGQVRITTPDEIKEDLIISHVAYDNKSIDHNTYKKWTASDTLWLTPNNLVLDELLILSQRDKKWKKRFKKFKKGFIGKGRAASKCTIENPEVLRFEERDGTLHVSAIDLIIINNGYLGYKIYYWLNFYTEEKDGSTQYAGKAKFEPYGEHKYVKRRNQIYKGSPKHFFNHFINNQHEEYGYSIAFYKDVGNESVKLKMPDHEDLILKTDDGDYRFIFPGYLEVTNKKIKVQQINNVNIQLSNKEIQKFGNAPQSQSVKRVPAKSYISKNTGYILLSKNGNILNTQNIKEYGYWADQRMAQMLPLEYNDGNKLKKDKLNPTSSSTLATLVDIYKSPQGPKRNTLLDNLNNSWSPAYIAPLIDLIFISPDNDLRDQIIKILNDRTGKKHNDYFDWIQWLWGEEGTYDKEYLNTKAFIYKQIDPRFEKYFKGRQSQTSISPDEIIWGGVKQDGIPPLRNPAHISPNEAQYLADDDIIFGITVNGEAKAYPKRIIAWHEFFEDMIGEVKIAGVYCTLCGTVIAYESGAHSLGTSGFLYRSNKLMYDKSTMSLWNTIEGKPVVGPLVQDSIKLRSHPVITTTWSDWKKAYPNTKVLSLSTGHQRNYDEGKAYQEYFATDKLMFPVPISDPRLANKEEVFIIRSEGYEKDPTAISIDLLMENKISHFKIDNKNIVALTDSAGATKVFYAGNHLFKEKQEDKLIDEKQNSWTISDAYLENEQGVKLNRIPTHRVFWFAWVNMYPNTKLIK